LVPEIDTIISTKGQKNTEKLHACKNTLNMFKLTIIKTWEIELLDHFHLKIKLSFHSSNDVIFHPSHKTVPLTDKSNIKTCHTITVLKLAKSYGCTMIAGILQNLLWKFASRMTLGRDP